MRPEDRDQAYLWDMRKEARQITAFIAGVSFSEFTNTRILRRRISEG